MNTLRSLAFVIFMYGLIVVMGTLGIWLLLAPRTWARAYFRVFLTIIWGALAVICGIRFEVRGQENIPQGGALIASNHQSMFETLAFWDILPDPAIILKKSLAYLPFFGWFALKLKNITVDRSAAAKALRGMLRDAAARAEEGRQVLIFPEGTRVTPGDNPDFKPGVAGLYAAMKVPCVPVALNSGLYWPAHGFKRHAGVIVVEFLEPIEPGLSKDEFLTTLRERINTASDALLPGGKE
ncbi:lysophospholipid acyltransferase family protein [Maricaulis sp. D1M11]|uniref:lysophospholipid acyltransferase family protein n=1 Tax=Maricaulis sp. D1M11 TaxID=3076117 RepID=UPI0039B63407